MIIISVIIMIFVMIPSTDSYSCVVRPHDDRRVRDPHLRTREEEGSQERNQITRTNIRTECTPASRRPPGCLSSAAASLPRVHSLTRSTFHVMFVLISFLILTSSAAHSSDTSSSSSSSPAPKYSFNGFAGGLILDPVGEKVESVLSKRSAEASDTDGIEELPLPSALRLEEKPATMPEISLPTVTVRGFLNLRTTVDGTVIVFTPSSSAAASTSTAKAEAELIQSTKVKPLPSPQSFTYETPVRSAVAPSVASQWSTSYRPSTIDPQTIDAFPVQSSVPSAVYPTGVVTVIADSNVGANGETTIQETKVIGTYIEGKYAQILKSSTYTPTPVMPTATFTQDADSGTRRPEWKRPTPARNSIHAPRLRNKEEPVARFTRGDRGDEGDGPTEPSTSAGTPDSGARVRIRKPAARVPGRYTWSRPPSERVRLNRFKIKASGDQSSTPTSRFTARDENEREAAKLLNQRLNRRLGISRATPPENRAPAPLEAPSSSPDEGDKASSGRPYDLPLLEGMLMQPAAPVPAATQVSRQVVTELTTLLSEVTRGFAGGEPLIETITQTSAIERTIEVMPTVAGPMAASSEYVTLASGMMQGIPDGMFTLAHTPPLPATAAPLLVTKTFTLTESSSRTSLLPSTEGSLTTTHTITENLVIRKLITGEPLASSLR